VDRGEKPVSLAVHNEFEWWERIQRRWTACLSVSPGRRRALLGLSIAGVGAIALALALVDGFAKGFRVWLPCWLMLVGWLMITPVRTVRATSMLRLFSLGALWALLIARLSTALANGAGLRVSLPGSAIGIASVFEESLKLLPLAILAVLAPSRVRRLGATDWAVLGITLGMGFQAMEDFVRHMTERIGLLNLLGDDWAYGWTLFGGRLDQGGVEYPGHQIATGLVAVSIGLVLGVRRFRSWLAVLPIAMWVVVIADHAALNAAASFVTDRFGDTTTVPRWIDAVSAWTGSGAGRGWLLVALIVVAMVLDSHRIAPHQPSPKPLPLPGQVLTPPSAPSTVKARLGRVGLAFRSLVEVVRQTITASRVAVAAISGQPFKARVVGTLVGLERARTARIDALSASGGSDQRRYRLVAAGVGIAATALAAWFGARLARQIGSGYATGNWFAGLLDALAHFWDGLGPGGQALLLIAGLGLLLVGGGFFAIPVLTATGELVIVGVAGSTTATVTGATLVTMAVAGAGANATHATDKPAKNGSSADQAINSVDDAAVLVGPKISQQMGPRGWSRDLIDDTISKPARTVATRDTRWNAAGTRLDDPATAFVRGDESYLVRNDVTGDIVQVSNRNDPRWVAPWD